MKNRNWKIVYSSYEGVEKRAVEFVSREIGSMILRDPGIYSVHVIACEKAGCPLDKNAIVIGRREENEVLNRFLKAEDVPAGGYIVRIIDNPDAPGCQLVLIAGDTSSAVLWGAVDFVDDGIPAISPLFDGHNFETDIFESDRLNPYESRRAPLSKVRSVFFWGHTVDDYEKRFENLARLKFNEVIIWNEYPPVNARDVVECAHSWGIAVIWGYSWGWSTDCTKFDVATLTKLSDDIVDEWRNVWKPLGGDGIYFQSFTETHNSMLGDKPIAEIVTDFVNKTCAKILNESPNERIEFGLHATSVWDYMDYIAKVDNRLEIIWEDCGGFPYKTVLPYDKEGTTKFTAAMIAQNRPMGLVFKCQAMLDWSRNRFNHQPGPYILGRAGDVVLKQDVEMLEQIWRHYTAQWRERGEYAYELAKFIHREGKGKVTMNLVGNLVGDIHFPTALCSEIFWSTDESYQTILTRIAKRRCVLQ